MRISYCKSKRGDYTLAEAFVPNSWGIEHGAEPYVRVYPFNIMLETWFFKPSIDDIITISYVHELSHIFNPNMSEGQIRKIEKALLKAIDLQRNQVFAFH